MRFEIVKKMLDFLILVLIPVNLYIGFHGKIDPLNICVAFYCTGYLTYEWIEGRKYD